MGGRQDDCKPWFLIFVPCLIWSCMPPWGDLCMMMSFMLSQIMYYSVENFKSLLFLSTLVLLLWTKNILRRWYKSQIMTGDFIGKLLYLVITAILSITAVVMVWLPLNEGYDCVVSHVVDRSRMPTARAWRDWIFLFMAIVLSVTAVAQTDICLKPSRVDEGGFPWVVKRLAQKLGRTLNALFRSLGFILRCSWRMVRCINRQAFCFPIFIFRCAGFRKTDYETGGGIDNCGSDSDSDVFYDSEQEMPKRRSSRCKTPAKKVKRPPTPPNTCRPGRSADESSGSDDECPPQGRKRKKSKCEECPPRQPIPKGTKRARKSSSEYSCVETTSTLLARCIGPDGKPCLVRPRGGGGTRGACLKADDTGRCKKMNEVSGESEGRLTNSLSDSLRSVFESTSSLLKRCIMPWANDGRKNDDCRAECDGDDDDDDYDEDDDDDQAVCGGGDTKKKKRQQQRNERTQQRNQTTQQRNVDDRKRKKNVECDDDDDDDIPLVCDDDDDAYLLESEDSATGVSQTDCADTMEYDEDAQPCNSFILDNIKARFMPKTKRNKKAAKGKDKKKCKATVGAGFKAHKGQAGKDPDPASSPSDTSTTILLQNCVTPPETGSSANDSGSSGVTESSSTLTSVSTAAEEPPPKDKKKKGKKLLAARLRKRSTSQRRRPIDADNESESSLLKNASKHKTLATSSSSLIGPKQHTVNTRRKIQTYRPSESSMSNCTSVVLSRCILPECRQEQLMNGRPTPSRPPVRHNTRPQRGLNRGANSPVNRRLPHRGAGIRATSPVNRRVPQRGVGNRATSPVNRRMPPPRSPGNRATSPINRRMPPPRSPGNRATSPVNRRMPQRGAANRATSPTGLNRRVPPQRRGANRATSPPPQRFSTRVTSPPNRFSNRAPTSPLVGNRPSPLRGANRASSPLPRGHGAPSPPNPNAAGRRTLVCDVGAAAAPGARPSPLTRSQMRDQKQRDLPLRRRAGSKGKRQ